MQTSSTTNIKKKHFPLGLNVLFIGHNHDEARSVEHFHEYIHEASERISRCNKNNESDDDNHLLLSGRNCFFFCMGCKYALQ
jgi:hypothetical protein